VKMAVIEEIKEYEDSGEEQSGKQMPGIFE
jgi:hypothetical protein